MTTEELLSVKNRHPADEFITFRESDHKYWIRDNDINVISVTTYIHQFFSDFDTENVIKNILRSDRYKEDETYIYYQKSSDEIKKLWNDTKVEASSAGINLHKDIEDFYNGKEVNNTSDEFKQFLAFYEDNKDMKIYRTEWMIYSEILRLTGSIDAVYMNDDGTLTLGDWKRSKEIKLTSFNGDCGKFPFNKLQDCNYIHYSLQLNLYRVILEYFYGFKIKEMFLGIFHPNNDGNKYMKIPITRMFVEGDLMLDARRKELIELGYDSEVLNSLKLSHLVPAVERKVMRQESKSLIGYSELSEKQKEAYDLVLKGRNVFITGEAGSGKSHLISLIRSNVSRFKQIVVTSTTGISAVSINGVTLFSYLGIGLGTGEATNLYLKIKKSPTHLKRWKELNVLVIDEVSMLSPVLFDKLETLARSIRQNNLPFGGIQLVLSGDFFQLPPVKADGELCFDALSWERCIGDNIINLTKNFRQETDVEFQTCLNECRIGELSQKTIDMLKSRVGVKIENDYGILPTRLYSLNSDVDCENESEMSRLLKEDDSLEVFQYDLTYKINKPGMKYTEEFIKKNVNAPFTLELCKGAQVMLLQNLEIESQLCNGSRGVVVGFNKSDLPIVTFLNGEKRVIQHHTWIVEENGVEICSIEQVPLKLAYAMSIHKSQSSTLDCVIVDLANIFEYGQFYTALSRCRALKGLSLRNFNLSCVRTNEKVIEFYKKLR